MVSNPDYNQRGAHSTDDLARGGTARNELKPVLSNNSIQREERERLLRQNNSGGDDVEEFDL